MICNGASGVDSSGPPGRNSEETPEVRHGSNSPFVQMRRVVSSSLHPWVYLFTWCSLLLGLSAAAKVWLLVVGKKMGHCRFQYAELMSREARVGLSLGAPFCQ